MSARWSMASSVRGGVGVWASGAWLARYSCTRHFFTVKETLEIRLRRSPLASPTLLRAPFNLQRTQVS